jgi:hypothetical protein
MSDGIRAVKVRNLHLTGVRSLVRHNDSTERRVNPDKPELNSGTITARSNGMKSRVRPSTIDCNNFNRRTLTGKRD